MFLSVGLRNSVDVSGIFYFFLLRGGDDFLLKFQKGGVSWVGGGGGREGVCRELGMGPKYFFSGPKGPPRKAKAKAKDNIWDFIYM